MSPMVSPDDRRRLIKKAEIMWGSFVRCPTNGRILEVLAGDDKVLCGCRVSNPKVRTERAELTGVHLVRFCEAVTATDYVDERLASGGLV